MEHSWYQDYDHIPQPAFTVIEDEDLKTFIGFYRLRERVRVKAVSRKQETS